MASKYVNQGRSTRDLVCQFWGGLFPTCPYHYGCFWYGAKLPWRPQAARVLQQLRHFDSLT